MTKGPWIIGTTQRIHFKGNDPKGVTDKQDRIPRRMERLIPPGGPPSDGSDSDNGSEPN